MSVTRKHSLYGVQFDATMIGVTSGMIDLGYDVQADRTSGAVSPKIATINSIKPNAQLTTKAIAAALDQSALTGLDISTLTAGLNCYGYKHASGGSRATGANHRKFNTVAGMIAPTTLSAQGRQDAVLNYDARIIHDGSANDPVIITDAVSVPTDATDAERFALGPVTVGGISLTHLRSLEIAFGLTIVTEGDGSSVYDTFASIEAIEPVITLRGIDPEWLKSANIPFGGKAAAHANTTIYLRKRLGYSTFVADNVAEHVKFTAAGLAVIPTPYDASVGNPNELMLVLTCIHDGTNNPILIDTTSTIT
jgi:hypothetical protein